MTSKKTQIRFFGKDGDHAIFSNFAPSPMKIDGKDYYTVEHFFQSMKFVDTDPEYAESIRVARGPKMAKDLGKSREHMMNPLWSGPKGYAIKVMRKALFCKALQNKRFYDCLLSTGDSEIIEASPWDNIWGEGKDGKGQNLMGKLLMELRKKLKKAGDNFCTFGHERRQYRGQ